MTTSSHDIRLTVFGCRAGMPEPGWPSSGYLVHLRDGDILLDCGPGVAAKAATTAAGLSAVFISHMHVDHCLDLLTLGKALSYQATDRSRVTAYVPPGAAATFRQFNELFPLGPDGPGPYRTDHVFSDVFDVIEYVPGQAIEVAGASVEPVPMQHRLPCCGFRVTSSGQTLAYSADTAATPSFERLAGGADLLLAEATLTEPDTTAHGHLCASEAGQIAARYGVQSLVLTHWAHTDHTWLAAQGERAAQHFGGRIDLAVPDHTFHL